MATRKTGATKVIEQIGHQLYKSGATDVEIAAKVGCFKSLVWRWRRKHGYEANAPTGTEDWFACRKTVVKNGEEVLAMHALGLDDSQAAARLGISQGAFRCRRRRMGIPSQRYLRKHPGSLVWLHKDDQ